MKSEERGEETACSFLSKLPIALEHPLPAQQQQNANSKMAQKTVSCQPAPVLSSLVLPGVRPTVFGGAIRLPNVRDTEMLPRPPTHPQTQVLRFNAIQPVLSPYTSNAPTYPYGSKLPNAQTAFGVRETPPARNGGNRP